LSTISYSSNDYDEAVAQADQALAVLATAGLAQSRQALGLRIRRAAAMNSLGKAQQVADELGPYVDELRRVTDSTAVDGLTAYSDARLVSGHVDDAVALSREASMIADTLYGRDSEQAIAIALQQGDLLATAGFNREGEIALEAALARRRASGIPPDHRLANSLQNLAAVKYHLGRHAESERLVRESIVLLRQIYTAPHEKIADALFSLGLPLMNSGRVDEAETVMLEAAGMYSALFPPTHLQNAGMLDGLGSLELRRQRFDKALEYFERATQLCNDPSLADTPDCGRHWQNLSHAYLKVHRIDDAAKANANSLALRRRLLGDTHPAVAGSLAGRAAVELERGKPDEALKTIDQALAIFGAAGQSDSLGGAVMRRTRAHALKDLHRYPEALAMLDQADAIAARVQPDDDEYRVVALVVRAETLHDSGRTDEARAVARTALTLPIGGAMLGAERWRRVEAMAR
jgi:tetratricopeptide (TPR) repeat protein